MFSKLYWVIGSALLALYFYTESRGIVYASTDTKSTIPKEARSRGGARSHGFWYVGGYRGGK